MGRQWLNASPIPKNTTTITPATASRISETTATSPAVDLATSIATVSPSSNIRRFVRLWYKQERPAVVTLCSSNTLLNAVVSFLD